MLRSIFIFLAASLLFSASSYGQTEKNKTIGFYGHRFTLQLGVGGHHNTLLKLASYQERKLRTTAYYTKYRNKIKDDQFNYSFYGSLGFMLKERTALSFDFTYYTGNIFLERVNQKEIYDEYGYYYSTVGGYDARVNYTTLRIMPRIEIGSKGSNMPTGLVNVLGIGVELSKLKSGNYQAITSYDYYQLTGSMDSVFISNQRLKFKDEFSVNLTLMYGLEYRLALSKNIAWNFGGYAHVNFPIQAAIDDLFGTIDFGYGTNYDEEHKIQVSRYRFQNLFSVRTGIVIML